jgi:hypothetical protein
MDDAGTGLPESAAVFGRGRAQEVVDLPAFVERRAQVGVGVGAGLDEMVAVDRRRHGDAFAPGLHELQHAALAENVLEHDAIRTQRQVAAARLQLRAFRIVEVAQQHLVRQGQRTPQPAADDCEFSLHRRVEPGGRFRRRFDLDHAWLHRK